MAFVRVFRILLIVGGVLALAGISLVVSSLGSSSSSTTSIPAGVRYYMYYEINILGSGSLRGDYQEISGGSLDVFVMTQDQYDSYRTGSNFGSLWSLGSSRGGTIDVSLPGSGRYFLVAQHGTSYEETAQVVRLTVHLSGINPTTFGSGLSMLGAGLSIGSWGVLRWGRWRAGSSGATAHGGPAPEARHPPGLP
ncbi:MAG: hypothetical protein E6J94_04915 [Methanobacteriota archaeon]|nr:MAG: hypothetical protein E6J99_00905 [Euryarchaeota archaeon]TMA07411.1 MAG: hypothetical protein E6J94_04915 [Euryarchaeota archaeon]